MPLQITGRHMTVTDEHRDYIDKKVNRLRRLCPNIDELSFTLTKEKLQIEAEGRLRAGRLVAQAVVSASKTHEAIDLLVDKLEAQISRTKERQANKKGNGRENGLGGEEEDTDLTEEEIIEA